jgi:hypothetical protein
MKDMNLPAKARLFWLLPEDRVRPRRRGRFATPARFDLQTDEDWSANAWSLVVHPEGPLDPSGYQIAQIGFLVPDAPHDWLLVGEKFTLLEGPLAIARGEVTVATR